MLRINPFQPNSSRKTRFRPRAVVVAIAVPLFAIAGLTLSGGSAAYAGAPSGSVVDQSNETGGGLNFEEINGSYTRAETFTAGKSGLLTAVDIDLYLLNPSYPDGVTTVSIMRTTSTGAPDGVVLATGTVAAGFVGPTTVAISPVVPMINGDKYAIELSSPDTIDPAVYHPGTYSGGSMYAAYGNVWTTPDGDGSNLYFATYVDQSANSAPTLSGTPTGAAKNEAFSYHYTAGGSPAPDVTVTSGALPPGLSLSKAGVLSGTPTSTGTFTYSLSAANGIGSPATLNASVQVGNAPGAPTIDHADAGDGEAQVYFAPPADSGDSAVTGYTATSSPDGITATGTTSPIDVGGLTNGTPYTFTVRATSTAGTGDASSASNSVTPHTTPATPTDLGAGASDGTVELYWTPPPATDANPITGYYIEYEPAGASVWLNATPTTSPTTIVSGLTNGQAYDFRVGAYNDFGSDDWSNQVRATPYLLSMAITSANGKPVDGTTLSAGDHVVLAASDLPPDGTLTAVLHSVPVTLGTKAVASDGKVHLTVTIPAGTAAGAHRLIATITGPTDVDGTATASFRVSRAPLALTGSTEPWVGEIIALVLLLGLGAALLIVRRRWTFLLQFDQRRH